MGLSENVVYLAGNFIGMIMKSWTSGYTIFRHTHITG